jgi:nitrogenase iron protein NifH
MNKIAFYGKGGIGKSTTAANVAAALAEKGYSVCQIGCDPKNDSTRLLLGKSCQQTVLDMVRLYGNQVTTAQLVQMGYAGVQCVEAGGPEPGVGCAGRGISVALEKLRSLQVIREEQVVIYDVLGDVVCGGFAVPIREGYATDIYIVSSGELMSLYAANNIAKGIARFAGRGPARLGGIIGNSRSILNEPELLKSFAAKLNTRLIALIPWDPIVHQGEIHRKTVLELAPQSPQAEGYRQLAGAIIANRQQTAPTPLAFSELEELVLAYDNE